ncbi:MAG: NAD(P)H-hydrate dehydratase [Acidobacteriaceae bacterium]
MKILTAQEMGAADQRSIDAGVSGPTLMQHAGAAVARFCERRMGGGGLVVVLAGRGNNGGDGMVAGLRLFEAGRKVRVVLLGNTGDVKGDAAFALEAVLRRRDEDPEGLEFVEVTAAESLQEALEGATLVIDAVVGTGFKPPIRGLAEVAQRMLQASGVEVVAVDLPSGWDADSIEMQAPGAFRADAVVTFAAPKVAHVFGHLTEGKRFGPVVVAPIGTPPEAIQSSNRLFWTGSAKAIAEKPRAIDGNKGRMGHVLLVGGAFGKAGAPSMASVAALRAGAGLVTAAVPREIVSMVASVAPELMLSPLATEGSGGLVLETLDEPALASLLKGISVVGIGPGLGQEGATPEWVRRFVERVTLPMVIDADALNAFSGQTKLLKSAVQAAATMGKPRTIVLTPHPGEMARLVGKTVREIEAGRVDFARSFALEHGVTLVLKGWRTLVAHPDGSVAVNTSGNPSMAKGGSGDILTGIVAAMLGQYGAENVARAVEAAVFLHGLAGDFACLTQDEHTVLAMDTVGRLWQAFRTQVTDEDGFTWVAGTAFANAGKVAEAEFAHPSARAGFRGER